jgi:HD-like signal output (HDOD) protein
MNERRLLIVGADDQLVARLRRIFPREERAPWSVEFSASPAAALESLAREGGHVIVRGEPRELDAARFLAQIAVRHPESARLLWQGTPGGDGTVVGAPQVVMAQGTDGELRGRIEGACALHTVFSSPALHRVVGAIESLPAVPRTYLALVDAAANPDVGVGDLAAIVARDPALCVKVLQLANSAVFGATKRMGSIGQAVSFLGITMLKALVLSAHAFDASVIPTARCFSLEVFQGYSMQVARLARRFLPDRSVADDAFTAGLLHDIGKLVIALRRPEAFDEIGRLVAETGERHHVLEGRLLGVSHAEVGAYLLGHWGLPVPLVATVAYHHTPRAHPGGADRRVMAAVHAADALLGILACGEGEDSLDVTFLEAAGVAAELPRWRQLAQAEILGT